MFVEIGDWELVLCATDGGLDIVIFYKPLGDFFARHLENKGVL